MSKPTGAIPENPSSQLEVVLKWLEAISSNDIDLLASIIADDYAHHILPKSLGVPIRDRAEFLEYNKLTLPMFRNFNVTIHEILEVPGKINFHASSTATSTTGHLYSNEYSVTVHVAQQSDGQHKMALTKEFVDSKFSSEFFAAERKRQEAAKNEANKGL